MFEGKSLLMRERTGGLNLVLLILMFVCAGQAYAEDAQRQVRIGVLAKRGPERCMENWTPTAEYLSEQIPGHTFEIVPLRYDETNSALDRDEVDFALGNPSLYIELEMRNGVSRIATLKNLRLGHVTTTYGGVIFHRADRDDIKRLADLKGKRFMAVDEHSLGGWQAAWREMKEKGINPHRDFKQLLFGGTHDAVVYAVRDGKVDAGTIRTDTLERMQAEEKIRISDFHVIHEHGGGKVCLPFLHSTREYPEWLFARADHTPMELAEKVAVALLKMPADSPAAKAANCAGWTIPLSYEPVRECIRELRIGPYKDHGRVTAGDVIRNYWYWLIIIAAAMAAMTAATVYVLRLNRRLNQTQSDLQKELAEREQAEKQIAIFRRFADASGQGFGMAALDHELTYVNATFCRILGEDSPDDALGKRFVSYYSEETQERLRDEILPGVLQGEQWVGELDLVSTDGRIIPTITNFFTIRDENEKAVYYAGVFSDITERKEAEEELHRAKEVAEVATRAKSGFLANMSHEIRTPMTAILGYTDLMMDPRQDVSERLNCLSVIRRNGEHLLGLINDILDISRIEAGKFTIEQRPCSVPSVVAEVTSTMRVRADERGISLTAEYAGELPETILTDQSRLRQGLINLVGNAVKFTETGGVRLNISFLPEWRNSQPAVRIEVADTGVGIAPDDLKRLFQPFVQVDSSASRKYEGTGLGLAITRRIIELMGGELTAESATGKGSTFTVTIPTGDLKGVRMLDRPEEAVVADGQSAGPSDFSSNPLAGKRILVAEDGEDNMRLIRAILRKTGAEVVAAPNGRVAVDLAMREPFDVILMDIQMPVMDGYQATSYLRSKGYAGPIIALTAHAMASDRERCISAGCDDYFTKPIDRGQLIAGVAKRLGVDVAGVGAGQPAGPADAALFENDEAIRSELADDTDLSEVIDQFVTGLSGQIEAMREAAANGHYERLRRLAHQLKGAGGSYGYPLLTTAARTLEDAARAGDIEAANLALNRLAGLCRAIVRGRDGARVGGSNK